MVLASSALAAAALAELRSLRRAVRTWVFLGIGLAVAFTAYGYYSYLREAVAFNPNAGFMSPRYTSAYFTIYLLWLFMAAVVFLAFDGRGRDVRAGIAEVVDSRPVSNLAVLTGRLGAVVSVTVVPLLAGQILIQAVGYVAQATGFDMLGPLQGVSLVTFVLVDALPALVLWSAFVLLLAAGLQNRLAVAGISLGLLGCAHVGVCARAELPAPGPVADDGSRHLGIRLGAPVPHRRELRTARVRVARRDGLRARRGERVTP